jgi:amino acid permease
VLCVLLQFFFLVTVAAICLSDRQLVPDLGPSLNEAAFQPRMPIFQGILATTPLLIFDFLIQGNVVQVYSEMSDRSPGNFKKVLVTYCVVTSLLYIISGYFGYATWV